MVGRSLSSQRVSSVRVGPVEIIKQQVVEGDIVEGGEGVTIRVTQGLGVLVDGLGDA